MKQLPALLLGCTLLLLCAACGGAGAASSAPPVPPAASSEGADVQPPAQPISESSDSQSSAGGAQDRREGEPLPSCLVGDGEDRSAPGYAPCAVGETYTLDGSVTVAPGRVLTLRLHGLRREEDRYGVSSIDVLEGETPLQTLSIRDASNAEYETDEQGEVWTDFYAKDGDLVTEDLNFDGAGDVSLVEALGTVNVSRFFWLWDPETERFDYAFSLCGYDCRIDREGKRLITEYRDGYGQYYTDYHAYDDAGALQVVRRIHEDCGVVTVYERVGGELQKVS